MNLDTCTATFGKCGTVGSEGKWWWHRMEQGNKRNSRWRAHLFLMIDTKLTHLSVTEAIYYRTLIGHTSEKYSSNQGFLSRGLGLNEANSSSYLYPWIQLTQRRCSDWVLILSLGLIKGQICLPEEQGVNCALRPINSSHSFIPKKKIVKCKYCLLLLIENKISPGLDMYVDNDSMLVYQAWGTWVQSPVMGQSRSWEEVCWVHSWVNAKWYLHTQVAQGSSQHSWVV